MNYVMRILFSFTNEMFPRDVEELNYKSPKFKPWRAFGIALFAGSLLLNGIMGWRVILLADEVAAYRADKANLCTAKLKEMATICLARCPIQ